MTSIRSVFIAAITLIVVASLCWLALGVGSLEQATQDVVRPVEVRAPTSELLPQALSGNESSGQGRQAAAASDSSPVSPESHPSDEASALQRKAVHAELSRLMEVVESHSNLTSLHVQVQESTTLEQRDQAGNLSPSLRTDPIHLRSDHWPITPRILVRTDNAIGDGSTPGNETIPGTDLQPGVRSYRVYRGKKYWVGAIGGAFQGEMQPVTIRNSAEPTIVFLTEPSPQPLGRIEVHIFDGPTELLGGPTEPEFTLDLQSLENSVDLLSKGFCSALSPLEFIAPPGRYRLVASGTPSFHLTDGHILAPGRFLNRVELVVDIATAITNSYEIHFESAVTQELDLSDLQFLLPSEDFSK